MRSRNNILSSFLRGLACLLLLGITGAPLAWAEQDLNAVDQAPAKKKSANNNAPVNSNDLMGAMRQTLTQPAPMNAPGPASVPSMPLPPPPVAEVQPAPSAPVVKTVAPRLVSEPVVPSAPPAPPVIASTPAAAPEKPTENDVLIPATPDKPVASTTDKPTTNSVKPAAVETPTASLSTNGAPLLSDMDDAPHVLGGGPQPSAGNGMEPGSTPEGMAATADASDKTSFSAPRRLFSKKSGKRAGVAVKQKASATELVPVADTMVPEPTPVEKPAEKVSVKKAEAKEKREEKTAERREAKRAEPAREEILTPAEPEEKKTNTLPPLKGMVAAEPVSQAPQAVSAGTSSSGSMMAPAPSSIEGVVIYSQEAGKPMPPAPASVPVLPPTPEKPPIVSDEIIAAPPVVPELVRTESASDAPSNPTLIPTAACGAANGVGTPMPPSSNLCASGTPTTVLGSGPWLWTCEMKEGGQAANCIAPLFLNGACGPAADNPQPSFPVVDLCRAGSPTSVMGSGPWDWTCDGKGGGISASCRAYQKPPTVTPIPAALPPANEITPVTQKSVNDCVPDVHRWTITCQQGGYPVNYAGVIVGETQKLCPTGVERGVWLSNSCVAATDSAPVSPSPGVLVTPPSPNTLPVAPPPEPSVAIKPVAPPRTRLKTPHFKDVEINNGGQSDATSPSTPVAPAATTDSVFFIDKSDALDVNAVTTLDDVASRANSNDKTILTLNAYAALPEGGDQQEAQRLSLARALAVRSYLMGKGVANNRIDVRALGASSDARGADRVDIVVGS